MQRKDAKTIIMYYRSIPEMKRLLQQERRELEDEYCGKAQWSDLRKAGPLTASGRSKTGCRFWRTTSGTFRAPLTL